ncbi:hypothetical protein [Thiomicrorhabdus immobilis]|nr:hypothetical protein [Thiomicrorhabdus immobilis]
MQNAIIKALLISSGLFSAIGFSSTGFADDSKPKSESEEKPLLERVANPKIKSYLSSLSSAQAYVGDYVQSTGERLDRFFGSDVLDVTHKGSRLIVYTPFTLYDNGDSYSSINFKAQIDLPRTNHRWKLLVSSFEGDEEQNVNSLNKTEISPSNTQQTVDSDSQNTLAGRYLFQVSKNAIGHVDLGLKFINYIEPNPYVKYKIRYKKDLTESIEARTTQNLYLERDRGFAWEGQQVFDYQYQPKWLARSQTSTTWWRDDAEVLLNQKAVLFESVSSITARAYFVDGNWTIDNQNAIFNSVALGMNWREKLYQDWLYGELEPRVTWTETDNFNEPIYSLRLMLEMHFYK